MRGFFHTLSVEEISTKYCRKSGIAMKPYVYNIYPITNSVIANWSIPYTSKDNKSLRKEDFKAQVYRSNLYLAV